MKREKLRPCRWKCGRLTDRRCLICIFCCNERDERNRQISAGTIPYVPMAELYKKPKRAQTAAQKNALELLHKKRIGVSSQEFAPGGDLKDSDRSKAQ